jgi:WD40 repeat protein
MKLNLLIICAALIATGCTSTVPALEGDITPAASEAASITETPTPTSTPIPLLTLGKPFTIGRGNIVAAEILSGAKRAVIARSGGIEAVGIEDATEVWWTPTDKSVIALTANPDGKFAAALLGDRSVLILNTQTGQEVHHFETTTTKLAYWGKIVWSPDGTMIAFQSLGRGSDDPVYLLDPESGEFHDIPST